MGQTMGSREELPRLFDQNQSVTLVCVNDLFLRDQSSPAPQMFFVLVDKCFRDLA